MPGYSKKGMVGYYTGSMGKMSIPASAGFKIVDANTGSVAEIKIRDQRGAAQPEETERSGLAGAGLVISADVDLCGSMLDPRQGPPLRVSVSADPQTLLGAGPRSWALDALPVTVELRLGGAGSGVLTVDVIASTCEGDVCTIRRIVREHNLTVL